MMNQPDEIEIRRIPLKDLLLDKENPRFGGNLSTPEDQASLLDSIIEQHGINDLLASMSENGYFNTEPVVAVEQDGKFTVVEGNRRVAAALILTNEDRARNHQKIREKWAPRIDQGKIKSLQEIPVSIFEKKSRELTAYLGTRHIRGNKPWDSYAKAHWMFELMLDSNLELTIKEAARLIGDQNPNTVKRILEAYILMRQLRDKRNYRPDSSRVNGRGSNADYPFSWVYTSIGYENIRSWIDIAGVESSDKIDSNTSVLKSDKAYENSEKLVIFMFGSKIQDKMPVISESRQIRLLNDLVKSRESIMALEHGKSAREAWENLRPVNDRLTGLIYDTKSNLETINTLVSRETLVLDDLNQFKDDIHKSRNLLDSVFTGLGNQLKK